ncbi:MAG: hypothetical protein SGBAC_006454 [Bacillariaceae sp.]
MAGVLMLAAMNTQMATPVQAISRPSPNSPINPSIQSPERPFDGPLAPGLQVSGGTRLKRAKNKIRKAARRMRASAQDLRLNTNVKSSAANAANAASTTASTYTTYTTSTEVLPQEQQQQQQQSPYQTEVVSTLSATTRATGIPEPVMIPIPPSSSSSSTAATNVAPQVAFLPPHNAKAASSSSSSSSSSQQQQHQQQQDGLSKKAILFMSLLAVQFGIQPVLVRKFAPRGICKSSVVMTQEFTKGIIALGAFYGSTCPNMRQFEISRLSLKSWLTMAGIPAAIYTVQNLASLLAYQNLEALTFNVLNQTKTLSAALCCFLVMGNKQSKVQSFSLVMLLLSALVIEKVVSYGSIAAILGNGVSTMMPTGRRFTHGVLPCLFASFLSGLAGALTQKNLQGVSKKKNNKNKTAVAVAVAETTTATKPNNKPINPYLFSMELTAASVLVLTTSLFFSKDGQQISQHGFFHLWTPKTMIPILTNSFGGILVGLVTKHAGSVRKGFALIFGILLSGFLQAGSHGISLAQIVGGLLAATSLWMHSCSSRSTRSSSMPKLAGNKKW